MKYTLTENTMTLRNGTVLHQIRAEEDFDDVCEGDLGGWIEKESNLSQEGDCWVYKSAIVYGNARVCGDATICWHARVDRYEDWATLTLDGSTITLFRNAKEFGGFEVKIIDGDGRLDEIFDVVAAMKKIFVEKMEAAHNEES